jgi:hypothetical protein
MINLVMNVLGVFTSAMSGYCPLLSMLIQNAYDLRPVPSPLLKRLGLVSDADLDPDKEYPHGGEYVTTRRRNVHNVKVFQKRRAGKTDKVGGLEVQSHFD